MGREGRGRGRGRKGRKWREEGKGEGEGGGRKGRGRLHHGFWGWTPLCMMVPHMRLYTKIANDIYNLSPT